MRHDRDSTGRDCRAGARGAQFHSAIDSLPVARLLPDIAYHATMDARSAGLFIVAFGVAVVVVGLIAMTGALAWFGRLPGDIRYSSGNTRVFFPITTMIIVSVVLSLLMYLVRRL